MKKIIGGIVFLCMLVTVANAQTDSSSIKKKKLHGTFYITWGYQKDFYTRSTVRVKDNSSDDYDFTLYNVKAHDRRDMEDLLNQPLTVPEYVFYGGYFFNNKKDLGIEIGWDHLKYIVTDGQNVHMKGNIRGTYYDQDTIINAPFFHYEHTNGNNYLTASLLKRYKFWNNSWISASFILKAGGGVLIPKTYSVMFGNERDGPFRVAGYVIAAGAAFRADIFDYFFIEASTKSAFAHYTHDKIYKNGVATQMFGSQQFILSAGFNIPLSK
ncbi:MAG: hypothetical protein U0U66_12900 [Cytophagaceae bacterium]